MANYQAAWMWPFPAPADDLSMVWLTPSELAAVRERFPLKCEPLAHWMWFGLEVRGERPGQAVVVHTRCVVRASAEYARW